MSDYVNGGPAFPYVETQERLPNGNVMHWIQPGMTLRDYFAAQALTGVIAARIGMPVENEVAEACYRFADAMIAEREK